MRVIVQRVAEASVTVGGDIVGEIAQGFLVLVGVRKDDTAEDARFLADKVANLRVFEDDAGKMNRSLLEVGGAALVVSNFTLYGDCRKGRRPGFTEAASGETADGIYRMFGETLAAQGVPVQWGRFGAEMKVALVNDGPVTLILESGSQAR